MNTKTLVVVCFLCLLSFSWFSCTRADDNAKREPTTAKQPAETPPEVVTPSKVVGIFLDACRKRDVEALAKILSKGSYRFAEEHAKKGNKTVAEVLNKCKISDQSVGAFNEKVYSDTATVDVQNVVTNQYDKIPFVKEDGQWKIAADQFELELKRRVDEDLNKKDQYYDDEENKIKNKYEIKVAQLEANITYTLEQKRDQLIAKGVLDQQEYKEKIALVNGRYSAKKKVLDDAQAIRRGIFYNCVFYSIL